MYKEGLEVFINMTEESLWHKKYVSGKTVVIRDTAMDNADVIKLDTSAVHKSAMDGTAINKVLLDITWEETRIMVYGVYAVGVMEDNHMVEMLDQLTFQHVREENTTWEEVSFIEWVELANKLVVFKIGDMATEEMTVIRIAEWARAVIDKVVYITVGKDKNMVYVAEMLGQHTHKEPLHLQLVKCVLGLTRRNTRWSGSATLLSRRGVVLVHSCQEDGRTWEKLDVFDEFNVEGDDREEQAALS
jgi:hypothetical protein